MINIDALILQAMKDKQEIKVKTYRAIKSEIQVYNTARNSKPYNESVEIQILNKMVKQREESKKQYLEANRQDLADVENIEIMYLQEFIPKAPSREEIEAWLEYNNFHTVSKREMGDVISTVKEAFPSASGRMISGIVKDLIIE